MNLLCIASYPKSDATKPNRIDINAKNANKQTPLFFAIENVDLKLVTKFLAEGAKVNVIDENGFTPLHYAIKSRNFEVLKALYNRYSSVAGKEKAKQLLNVKDREGNKLIYHAVKWVVVKIF